MKNIPLTPPGPPPSDGLDGIQGFKIFVFPLLAYVAGVFSRSDTLLVIAMLCWGPIYLLWCLWTMWRVTDRSPSQDSWRAVAILVFGAAGWFLVPGLVFVSGQAALYAAFPIMFLPAAVSLVAPRRTTQATLTPGRRTVMLWSAAALCWLLAVELGAIVVATRVDPSRWPDYLAWIAAPLAAGLGAIGAMLAHSAVRGFAPGRSSTAEAQLPDPTADAPSP